jgi:hypothetical protein
MTEEGDGRYRGVLAGAKVACSHSEAAKGSVHNDVHENAEETGKEIEECWLKGKAT